MEAKRKNLLFITNIPSPYRIDFYNELSKYHNVTVLFEAKRVAGINFNWKEDEIQFNAIFLKEGNIEERKVDWSIFHHLTDLKKYDRIILTSYSYATETAALLYLKFKSVPYFYEIDGAMPNFHENPVKRLIKQFFLSGAKCYFSSSKMTDEYIRYYAGKKAVIHRYPFTSLKKADLLPNVPSEAEKAALKKQLGITESQVVLAVGQFIHRKGFDILLKAAKQVDQAVGIYIVGGKPTPEYLRMQAEMKLSHVHFEGFKSKEELALYFKAVDLFVLPTREDIWGLVINEAMGYGLPVITTNRCVAGLELLPESTIIDADNVEQLASKINQLLHDKTLLHELAVRNLQKIQGYTTEAMVKAHLDIL